MFSRYVTAGGRVQGSASLPIATLWHGFALIAMLFVIGVHPVKANVAVAKDGNNFSIKTSVYQATINGQTGLLEKMIIDGATAIDTTSIDLSGRQFTKTQVVQESPTKVVMYVSAQDGDKVVDNALRVTYEAEESTLFVKVLSVVGKEVAGRGPRFQLGSDVQMVRSLEYKETVPMPVLQGRSPWMRVKFHYANGATLGILNSGPGNPYNANENGSVGGMTYSRGGFVPNSEYVYTLIAEKGAGKTLGSPSMAIAEASTPAVFWQGTPIQATLSIKKEHYQKLVGMPNLRVKYEVFDAFDKLAATGELPLDLAAGADPLVVKVPIKVTKLGWYRAYFTVNDDKGSLLEGKDRLIFSVLKHQGNMGETFDGSQLQTDYTIGLGYKRVSMDPSKVDEVARLVEENQKGVVGTDVNVGFQIDGSPVGNDPKRFGEVVFKLFDRVKDGIPRVEIINEPNGTLQPKEYVDTFLRSAFENIRKASPNTKVVGPVLCGISADQSRYLDELYKLGLKDLTDELSFHPYAGNFDDGNAVTDMQRLMQVIAANGDANKPITFTEAGYGHGGWSDPASLREIVKLATSQYVWQDAVMGIDYRHNFYYFTDSMGYLDWWMRANQLTTGAVGMRTFTGFVKGQDRPRRMDFGSLDVVRAFLYPGKDRQVVVLWTAANNVPADSPDPTTQVTFTTDAKTIEYFDCFGNPLAAKINKGKLTLNVGTYPTYMVLPAKAKFDAVPERWGTNVALSSLGATAESSTELGTNPAVSVIDGNTASFSCWRSMTPNEVPQTITVTFAGLTPIDRVGIWGYSPRGYDVEAMGADGKWAKLVSKRDQPYARFRTETFKNILTDQIRLTVVDSYTSHVEIAEFQVFSPTAGAGKAVELINWALASNGATAKASSVMKKDVSVAEMDWGATKPRINKITLEGKAENAIDGKRLIGGWRDFFPTTWMAAVDAKTPQWLEITFAGKKKISSVAVYTIAFSNWTPASSGIRDWDIQVWDGQQWQTVDTVKENVRVSKISRLKTPAVTDKIRIVVNATNDPMGSIGIMEVEAYGPRE